jgi:RecA-family ATPase
MSMTSFSTDFAAPSDYAKEYRRLGIQVVPGKKPNEDENWKRPKLERWKTFQNEPIPEATFESWYGPNAEHAKRESMGIITGKCSGNIFVIDLDEYKTPACREWWQGVLEANNYGTEPETWQQVTGGGGRQLFFRAPAEWHAPTNRTPIGVDIRGQGGFAVLPPSLHESGRTYEWCEGYAPWDIEIDEAPQWLLDSVDELVAQHGGHKGTSDQPRERTANLPTDFDAFGLRTNGREDTMTRMVWGAVLAWHRECPIKPPAVESEKRMMEVFASYVRTSQSRIKDLTASKVELLEREGRGITLFRQKWAREMRRWDDEVREAALVPPPNREPEPAIVVTPEIVEEAPPIAPEPIAAAEIDPADEPINVHDLNGSPKPREWVVKDWIPKNVVSTISGDGGVGKSLIAQQLLYAAGVNGKWLGLDVPAIRGLGVFCEDDKDELHRRHDAIKADLGHSIGNPFTDTWIWPRVGSDNLLVTFDKDNRPTMSDFFRLILKNVMEKKIGLLVLDTVADLFGGNEIIRSQVNFFIKSTCGAFIKHAGDNGLDLTVILLAHPSQAGKASGSGESGSTAWNNAVRARLYLTRPEEGLSDQRILTRKKANYAASGDDVKLELIWTDGVLRRLSAETDDERVAVKSIEAQMIQKVSAAWDADNPYKAKPGHPRFLDTCMLEEFGMREVPSARIAMALKAIREHEQIIAERQGDRRGYRIPVKNHRRNIDGASTAVDGK